jgi:hypothetical protein
MNYLNSRKAEINDKPESTRWKGNGKAWISSLQVRKKDGIHNSVSFGGVVRLCGGMSASW